MIFHESLSKAVADMKITSWTKIQELAMPIVLEGRDLIALSETGSGKTIAYLLPLLNALIGKPKRPTKVLIITPTKELAEQILAVAKKLARHTTLISTSIYGGKSQTEQVRDLKNGVHLIVACPGRLADHIEKGTIDLTGIETVVLDEADQLMDMGFLPHLKVAMEAAAGRKQTLLFSATMTEEVKGLAAEFLNNPETVEYKANQTKASIEEIFCPITKELRYSFLRFLFKEYKIKSAIIFTQTKEEARELGAALIADKYKAAVLEGDMTTHQRKKSLAGLKDKTINYLVATDIASRGLDVPHVSHVINFNPPLETENYVHRVGRTARHELAGTALSLYLPEEKEDWENILRELGRELKPKKFKEFNYALKINKKTTRVV